jgi:hypothetical protein
MKVTLVDSKNARDGYEFIMMDESEECTTCPLARVCLKNLEPGRRYRVTSVRDKEHRCSIFGRVRVVEVEECCVLGAMEEASVYPGATVTYSPQRCGEIFCESYQYCVPEGLRDGDSCRIEEELGRIRCDTGRRLRLVRLRRKA